MKITYETVQDIYELGTEKRTSYGITASETAGERVSVIASVHDISSDKQQIDGLVLLCNRLRLSPEHLYDVIEDFLAQ